jgi:hypothetical protein
MKFNKSIIKASLFGSMFLLGCSKQLEVSPQNAITQSSLTPTDVAQLRTGMYSKMEDVTFSFYFDFDKRGENFQAGPSTPALIDPVGLTPSDADILTLWQNAYSGLNIINFLISTVDNLGTNANSTIRSYKGEALYFRALTYYNLVTRWGGVPLVLKNTNEAIQRSTEAQVWSQIKSDLHAARTLVAPFTSNFYVSDQAVKALIAKVSIATGDQVNAVLYADSVINFSNNKFALASDSAAYSSIFVSGSPSKEIIFALANNSTANIHAFYSITNDTKASWTYSPTSFNFTNLFTDQSSPVLKRGDKRASATFTSDKTRVIKYPNGKAGQQLVATANSNATPIVISRFAEMYLIKAEAQGAALGSTILIPYFAARYNTPPTAASISSLSAAQFQDLILNENRREFYAEGYWWYDIKRTGRTDFLTTLAGRNYLLYYPIPQVQKDLAGYTQNPGY